MKCKGLIFDLDGTLLDTIEDLADAANNSLEALGFAKHPVDRYRYFVGEGLPVLVKRILPVSAGQEDVHTLMSKFIELYSENWNSKTRPYDGILDMLKNLSAKGLQLAVLSNKPHDFTVKCVKTYFPDTSFSFIFGSREGVPRKPDPAGAVEIADKMRLRAEEIIYVGDTATDMQTGNSAGMRTIGVEWGFRDQKELVANNAWKIVSTPVEVLNYAV